MQILVLFRASHMILYTICTCQIISLLSGLKLCLEIFIFSAVEVRMFSFFITFLKSSSFGYLRFNVTSHGMLREHVPLKLFWNNEMLSIILSFSLIKLN